MEIVRFAGIARWYGGHGVFAGLSGSLGSGQKIGLVGPNGAGKSSLARILAGREEPDAGTLTWEPDSRLGYLEQEASEGEARTLQAAFEETLAAGHAREWQMRAILDRFGFTSEDMGRPLREFSGGQRTRALLARTLLAEPDWLILDEPTNHLDMATTRRLEALVARDPRAMVIISHDRAFLENTATRIWELDAGELSVYDVTPGRAYSMYLQQREERREQARREYEKALSERARRQAVIDELRTHGSHNYAAVRSRERAFSKVAETQAPREAQRAIAVTLQAARRASNGFAVEVEGLGKAYDRPLFLDVRAQFARGERIAIVGPNGAGKSTFLRILAGELAPDSGTVRLGTGLRTASYSQSSVDDLPAGVSAVEAVMRMDVTNEQARALLGRMRLGGDAADKPVEAFSGGERRRIMLARLMAQRADCLFLDEPSNDLDIPSREALESVLTSYEGALFIVSHDRYLLRNFADRVVVIDNGAARIIDGDYATYERLEREREGAANGVADSAGSGDAGGLKASRAEASEATIARRDAHEKKRERERLKREATAAERRVADLEADRAEVERRFAAPETYEDPGAVVALQHALERLRMESQAAMAEWERALGLYEQAL